MAIPEVSVTVASMGDLQRDPNCMRYSPLSYNVCIILTQVLMNRFNINDYCAFVVGCHRQIYDTSDMLHVHTYSLLLSI